MTETNAHALICLGKLWLRLRCWLDPWLCPCCGTRMQPIFWSLPPDIQMIHYQAGTVHLLEHVFRCPRGCQKDGTLMIH